jgi:hypothetical protein
MRAERVMTGRDLAALHDEALWSVAEKTDLFVEVDPNQKERIILALKKMGHVVGFLGDGVNDAPPCTPPTPACRSSRRSTWPGKPPTSSSWNAASTSSGAASKRGARRLRTR